MSSNVESTLENTCPDCGTVVAEPMHNAAGELTHVCPAPSDSAVLASFLNDIEAETWEAKKARRPDPDRAARVLATSGLAPLDPRLLSLQSEAAAEIAMVRHLSPGLRDLASNLATALAQFADAYGHPSLVGGS